MSKTEQNSKCDKCGKYFLSTELKVHKRLCKHNKVSGAARCFHGSQNIKNIPNSIASNNQNNSYNFSLNFPISSNNLLLSLENNNSSSEEKLNTEGINNVTKLNSNFDNNLDFITNQNNITSFNGNSENSIYITGKKPLSTAILNKLDVLVMNNENINNDNYEQCSICQYRYELGEKYIILPCIHNYHEMCIKEWFNSHNICPLCRSSVDND